MKLWPFSKNDSVGDKPQNPSRRKLVGAGIAAGVLNFVPSIALARSSEVPPGIANSEHPLVHKTFGRIQAGDYKGALMLLERMQGGGSYRTLKDAKNAPEENIAVSGLTNFAINTDPAIVYLAKLVMPTGRIGAVFNRIKDPAMIHLSNAMDKYMTKYNGGLQNFATNDQIIEEAAKGYVVACGRPVNDWKELVNAIEEVNSKSPTLRYVNSLINKEANTQPLIASWAGFMMSVTMERKTGKPANVKGRIQRTPAGLVAHYIEATLKEKLLGYTVDGKTIMPGIEKVSISS